MCERNEWKWSLENTYINWECLVFEASVMFLKDQTLLKVEEAKAKLEEKNIWRNMRNRVWQ